MFDKQNKQKTGLEGPDKVIKCLQVSLAVAFAGTVYVTGQLITQAGDRNDKVQKDCTEELANEKTPETTYAQKFGACVDRQKSENKRTRAPVIVPMSGGRMMVM